MGWYFEGGTNGKSVRAYCDEKLTWENENAKNAVLKSAMVGATYYAAVKTEYKAEGKAPDIWAAVFLTKRCPRARDGFTFGYKDMDEGMGPCESECPVGILDLLSPTDREYANAWRARCRENAAKVSAFRKSKPKVGQKIRLAAPMNFGDGCKRQEFTVEAYMRRGKQMTGYRGEDGALCRITKIQNVAFEIIS